MIFGFLTFSLKNLSLPRPTALRSKCTLYLRVYPSIWQADNCREPVLEPLPRKTDLGNSWNISFNFCAFALQFLESLKLYFQKNGKGSSYRNRRMWSFGSKSCSTSLRRPKYFRSPRCRPFQGASRYFISILILTWTIWILVSRIARESPLLCLRPQLRKWRG